MKLLRLSLTTSSWHTGSPLWGHSQRFLLLSSIGVLAAMVPLSGCVFQPKPKSLFAHNPPAPPTIFSRVTPLTRATVNDSPRKTDIRRLIDYFSEKAVGALPEIKQGPTYHGEQPIISGMLPPLLTIWQSLAAIESGASATHQFEQDYQTLFDFTDAPHSIRAGSTVPDEQAAIDRGLTRVTRDGANMGMIVYPYYSDERVRNRVSWPPTANSFQSLSPSERNLFWEHTDIFAPAFDDAEGLYFLPEQTFPTSYRLVYLSAITHEIGLPEWRRRAWTCWINNQIYAPMSTRADQFVDLIAVPDVSTGSIRTRPRETAAGSEFAAITRSDERRTPPGERIEARLQVLDAMLRVSSYSGHPPVEMDLASATSTLRTLAGENWEQAGFPSEILGERVGSILDAFGLEQPVSIDLIDRGTADIEFISSEIRIRANSAFLFDLLTLAFVSAGASTIDSTLETWVGVPGLPRTSRTTNATDEVYRRYLLLVDFLLLHELAHVFPELTKDEVQCDSAALAAIGVVQDSDAEMLMASVRLAYEGQRQREAQDELVHRLANLRKKLQSTGG
ncbi:MAG: hypothetical protein NCW75_13785 [Phycisphaera sp.]|nr:MAG: hypothetical protein NCW75_13785 [Phycisphaera sp.]